MVPPADDIVRALGDDDAVTPEMIEAGVSAWRDSAGDEYPPNSTTADLTVQDIYYAMRAALVVPTADDIVRVLEDKLELQKAIRLTGGPYESLMAAQCRQRLYAAADAVPALFSKDHT